MIEKFIEETVDRAVSQRISTIADEIVNRLQERRPDEDKPRDIHWLCDYAGLKKSTVYSNIDKIPHRKLNNKGLRFIKSEIDEWMTQK